MNVLYYFTLGGELFTGFNRCSIEDFILINGYSKRTIILEYE